MVQVLLLELEFGLSTIKAFCDVYNKPCIGISSLEALAHTVYEEDSYICSLIDAKHDNVYASIFECNDEKYTKVLDFSFENIHELMKKIEIMKKKIFFVGNCGILYKDVIKSYMKSEISFLEDTFATSKYVGMTAFHKYQVGIFSDSFNLSALYLKNSSAEEAKK
jgi:tRNA threonylcarbamoyladenosine biosynthesis protein TsaB